MRVRLGFRRSLAAAGFSYAPRARSITCSSAILPWAVSRVCESQRPQRRKGHVGAADPNADLDQRLSAPATAHPCPRSEPDVRGIRRGENLERDLARQRPASTEIAVSRLKPAWRRIDAD